MQSGRLDGAMQLRGSAEAALAAHYHARLLSDPAVGRQTYLAIVDAHRRHRLMMGSRLLCNVLRPRFLAARRSEELARLSLAVAAMMERAGERLLASDRLLNQIGASDQERDVWSVDPGYPGFTLTSRLDSFIVGDALRFVEYNAESPAGIGFSDCLSDVFDDLPVLRHSDAPYLTRFHARDELFQTLLWAYRTWGGRDMPSIAVVDWEDVLTRRDFELCADYFRERGATTVVTDPRRLEYRGGSVWLGDQRITLVYRRVLLHELLAKASEAQPLLQAYRDGAICVVNSPRSKLLHKKAVFALLSDPELGLELDEEERSAVNATIPWTRILVDCRTTYDGRPVDLVNLLLEERHRFVLKPVDDYGGRGVVLGWETAMDDWQRAIENSLGTGFVVQERVDVPQVEFPVWEENGVAIVPLLVDTDPLLFRCKMGGIVTRVSGSALLNVSAGAGSTTPTFVIQGEGE